MTALIFLLVEAACHSLNKLTIGIISSAEVSLLAVISFDCSRILTISQFFKIMNVREEHGKGCFIASKADNNGFRV